MGLVNFSAHVGGATQVPPRGRAAECIEEGKFRLRAPRHDSVY
jgi:hypothetical protein